MQTGVDAKPVVRLFKTNEADFVLRCATEKVPAAAKYAAHQSPRRHFTADNTKSPKGSQRGAPEASNAARILLSFNRYISLGAHFPPALRGPDFPANKFRWWESRGQHGFDTRDCFGVKRGEEKKEQKKKTHLWRGKSPRAVTTTGGISAGGHGGKARVGEGDTRSLQCTSRSK